MKDYKKFAGKGITIESTTAKPNVTVMGGVHGNETVGIDVLEAILEMINDTKLKIGTLNLIAGNPSALEKNVRFVEQDLNRCFGEMPKNPTLEHKRAGELKPILGKTAILLDVHSTMKPSKAFIAAPTLNHPAASLLPHLNISTIVTGPGLLPPDGQAIYADTYVNSQGGFGITIEAGWREDPKTTHIISSVIKALEFIGIFDEEKHLQFLAAQMPVSDSEWVTPEGKKIEIFNAYKNLIAGENFAYAKEFNNWEEVSAGTLIATEGEGQNVTEIYAPVDSYLLFQKKKDSIVVGNEVCVLAEKIK